MSISEEESGWQFLPTFACIHFFYHFTITTCPENDGNIGRVWTEVFIKLPTFACICIFSYIPVVVRITTCPENVDNRGRVWAEVLAGKTRVHYCSREFTGNFYKTFRLKIIYSRLYKKTCIRIPSFKNAN
jgi:hypothetical protein